MRSRLLIFTTALILPLLICAAAFADVDVVEQYANYTPYLSANTITLYTGDNVTSISNSAFKNHADGLTVYGGEGSYVEEYCGAQGINFAIATAPTATPEPTDWQTPAPTEAPTEVPTMEPTPEPTVAPIQMRTKCRTAFYGGPATSGWPIGIVPKGGSVTVISSVDGQWSYIEYEDVCGYVRSAKLNYADNDEYDAFEVIDGALINYNGVSTHVVVPDDLGIDRIAAEAFCCNDTVVSVSIPYGVEVIEDYAFANCIKLTSINLPSSLTRIGEGAFDSTAIRNIELPDNVTEIGSGAFRFCNGIETVTFPSALRSLGMQVFDCCYSLKTVNVNDGMVKLPAYVLTECVNLEGVYIPESVTEIDDNFAILEFGKPDATIYCHEYSDADFWAVENGFKVVYVDRFDPDGIRTLSLEQDITIPCGQCAKIGIYIYPTYDDPAVAWESSDPEVASVADGVVTAHRSGRAVITATVGGASAVTEVICYIPADDYDIEREIWGVAKEKHTVAVDYISPSDADEPLEWSSSNDEIATVDRYGVISLKKPGTATITAVSGSGLMREATLHVCYPVTSIAFEPDSLETELGVELQLNAGVKARTQLTVNRLVTFTSSDESVATVNQNGVVTPVSRGTAKITATAANGVSASCTVRVRASEYYTLRLPKGLTEIGDEAFAGTPVERVVIPSGCAGIGAAAFADCDGLRVVEMPDSVEYIAPDAFNGCGNVSFVCESDNYAAAYARDRGISCTIK